MGLIKPLKAGLKFFLFLVLIVLIAGFFALSLLVMEYDHYLGRPFPYWILPFFPSFLVGRLMRRFGRAYLFGAAIPLAASLAFYLVFFVYRSGGMRLKGWIVDLWLWLLFLAVLILGSVSMGRWLRKWQKAPRRWGTVAACTLFILVSVFQVYLFFSGFINEVFFKLDLRKMPYDQAIVAVGDFFQKHYNYLEYKGVDWDKAVEEAASRSRQAKTEAEYFEIVTTLINLLGDGHLRVRAPESEKTSQQEIDLGVRWTKLENRWFVQGLTQGSPAAKAGLHIGMELLDVDNRIPADIISSAPDWRFNTKFGTVRGDRFGERGRLASMLRRPAGSSARLTLDEPAGGRRTIEVSYDKWDWPKSPYFDYRQLPGDIGYIRIGRFASDAFGLITSFDKALEELWDTRGLIIDVRNNPGGIGFITDTMLDRFCQERVYYGRLRGSGRRYSKFYVMPRRPLYLKPVALLVNENDFSASELFAFAASAVPGLVLVGRPTGGVVSAPSQQKIYLPAGLNIEFTFGSLTDEKGNFAVEWTGVQPDVVVPQTIEDLQSGRDRDLEVALQLLKDKEAAKKATVNPDRQPWLAAACSRGVGRELGDGGVGKAKKYGKLD